MIILRRILWDLLPLMSNLFGMWLRWVLRTPGSFWYGAGATENGLEACNYVYQIHISKKRKKKLPFCFPYPDLKRAAINITIKNIGLSRSNPRV